MIELPAVIGHRGAAGLAPENTVASFEAAATAGARWVEFDVRLSADGVPVVIHDPTLARTDGTAQRIDSLPAVALGGLPTLYQILDCLAALGLGANVEIKPERRAAAVGAATVAALAGRPLEAGVIVSSFDSRVLAALGRIAPDLPLGLLLRRPIAGAARLARRLGCVAIHCEQSTLSEPLLRGWRAAGFATVAYTVNEPYRAFRLLSWGCDAVISDVPGALIARLGACGRRAASRP